MIRNVRISRVSYEHGDDDQVTVVTVTYDDGIVQTVSNNQGIREVNQRLRAQMEGYPNAT